MFVKHDAVVAASLAQVEKGVERLRSGDEGFDGFVYQNGESLCSRVGPSAAVAREVRLTLGPVEVLRSGLVYSMSWTASEAAFFFPELAADLVLSKSGPNETVLTFRATYSPPLGVVGLLADRAILSRVAEATVADWTARLAAALGRDVAVRGALPTAG